MNKKGFTLVELIAVIVILALLALIANTSVTNVVKNSKSDLYNAQIQLIKSAAQTWGNDNFDKLPEDGKCSYITLGDLKGYGLFEEEIINPKTNKGFSDNMYIKMSSTVNSSGVLTTKYEVDVDNVSNCEKAYKPICVAVTEETKTIGNIPSGNYIPGDEYICSVNDTTQYHFFILSVEGNTVNLIMDSNINNDGTLAENTCITQSQNAERYNCLPWNLSGVSEDGPILSMQFLYDATKNWINIAPLNYIYIDYEERISNPPYAYNSFISQNGIGKITSKSNNVTTIGTNTNPLRARMLGHGESLKMLKEIQLSENPSIDFWLISTNSVSDGIVGIISPSDQNNYWTKITNNIGIRPVISVYKAYLD